MASSQNTKINRFTFHYDAKKKQLKLTATGALAVASTALGSVLILIPFKLIVAFVQKLL